MPKLNQQKADEIREKFKAGASQRQLAKDYGINQGSISSIVNNRSYSPTPKDSDGFPVDHSDQIKHLKSRNTKLVKRISALELTIFILQKKLGLIPQDAKFNSDPEADSPRYVCGIDTYSPDWIEFVNSEEGQEAIKYSESLDE